MITHRSTDVTVTESTGSIRYRKKSLEILSGLRGTLIWGKNNVAASSLNALSTANKVLLKSIVMCVTVPV